MKIGLLSDTHSWLDPKIAQYLAGCDQIWHAGDFGTIDISDALIKIAPLRGVYGNIDGKDVRIVHRQDQKFRIEGINVWMTHIGGYPNHYAKRIRDHIKRLKPQLFISGHSHILKVMRDPKIPGLLHINPGAAGRYGIHKMRTLVTFHIDDGKIHDLNVVELGKRADAFDD